MNDPKLNMFVAVLTGSMKALQQELNMFESLECVGMWY